MTSHDLEIGPSGDVDANRETSAFFFLGDLGWCLNEACGFRFKTPRLLIRDANGKIAGYSGVGDLSLQLESGLLECHDMHGGFKMPRWARAWFCRMNILRWDPALLLHAVD